MRRLLRAAFAAAVLGCALIGGAGAQAPGLSRNVLSGGIDSGQSAQRGSRINRGRALGLVDAPIDQVVKVVEDYANYPRFMPNFEITRVLSRRGGSALLFVQVKALHGLTKFWAEVKLRAHEAAPGSREIEARMTRGNLRQFEAAWRIKQVSPDQTLVTFELIADPELPFDAANGLISDQNEKEARKSVGALRQYIATHAPR
jgi:ribosome-associated toxin RatA of RatAB toxin-antitoxin module